MRPDHFPRSRGFTLIELMIVVAIVAILAAVALPSYRDYMLRGYLTDGTTLLSTMQASMERYYQDNRTYAPAGTLYPPCDTHNAQNLRTQGNFVATCSGTPTTSTYSIVATGIGPVNNVTYTLTLDATSGYSKSTTSFGNINWSLPSPNICWATKRGQAC